MTRPRLTRASIVRTGVGAALVAGSIAIPLTAAAQSPERAPNQVGCLPILCSATDAGDIDIDIGVDLDVLGGETEDPPPTPAPAPAPATPLPDDIVDLDLDLGIDADLGQLAVVDANVPVDAAIGTSPQRPVAVAIDSSPDVRATLVRIGDTPVADVVVNGVDVGADGAVPSRNTETGELATVDLDDLSCLASVAAIDTSGVACSGSALAGTDAGLADVGADADICNVSVAVLGAADRASCALEGPADDPADSTDEPTDATSSPPGGASDGGASDGPSGARSSQADDGSTLAVTGSSMLALLALAGAMTASGAAALAAKRRRLLP